MASILYCECGQRLTAVEPSKVIDGKFYGEHCFKKMESSTKEYINLSGDTIESICDYFKIMGWEVYTPPHNYWDHLVVLGKTATNYFIFWNKESIESGKSAIIVQDKMWEWFLYYPKGTASSVDDIQIIKGFDPTRKLVESL